MKFEYKAPELNIARFDIENVVTSSGTDGLSLTQGAMGEKVGSGNYETSSLSDFVEAIF